DWQRDVALRGRSPANNDVLLSFSPSDLCLLAGGPEVCKLRIVLKKSVIKPGVLFAATSCDWVEAASLP
ncbi:hypothetical protein NKH81_34850, partial [Mesorhizobium sp. M0959]|uniref:hypothetical protein n=1 Tax=Mesorhizobium sp. M0959 TaxID=2957034 RepID=UPI00333838E5